MNSKKRNIRDFIVQLQRLGIIVGLLAALALGVWFCHQMKGSHVEIGSDDTIGDTPTQIQSIKAIGEWEFLSISNEELVDTVRKGLLKDDQLVRIYYGTLRLGINMHQARPHWLTAQGDTVTAIAHLVQKGKTIHVWNVEVNNSAGELISIVTVTNYIISSKKTN